MKNIIKNLGAFILVFALAAAMSLPALAAEVTDEDNINTVPTVDELAATDMEVDALFSTMSSDELAYSNIRDVPERWKEAVLEARNEIIFNSSWVADGITGCVKDSNGNIIRRTPQFSEVFPADWEIPVMKAPDTTHNYADALSTDSVAERSDLEWETSTYQLTLTAPPTDYNTPPFTWRDNTSDNYERSKIDTYAISSTSTPASEYTFNVGYSNRLTGASLGVETYIPSGGSFEIDFPYGIQINVRASTYSPSYDWNVWVATYVKWY